MRREFSSFIRIAPIRNRQIGEPSTLTTYSDVSFDEEAKTSTQGILYDQSLKIAVPRAEAQAFLSLLPRFHAQVGLHDGSDFHLWGTIDIPVLVVVVPRIETVLLEMSCKSLLPLLHG
ncbi:hypothetical protein [Rikenella microfusus]|uniref:hypothetical protein n=1 Tax=Rikenella microfusus TaxID=28139 RepID=UPI00248F1A06|nr:hypothetical protein [Rikenella microfusus]